MFVIFDGMSSTSLLFDNLYSKTLLMNRQSMGFLYHASQGGSAQWSSHANKYAPDMISSHANKYAPDMISICS